jgi:hypothetical protein
MFPSQLGLDNSNSAPVVSVRAKKPFVPEPIPLSEAQDPKAIAEKKRQKEAAEPSPEAIDELFADFFAPTLKPEVKLEPIVKKEKPRVDLAKVEKRIKAKHAKKVATKKRVPFTFKSHIGSPDVYRKEYDRDNRHLPRARYGQDYAEYTFYTAAANNHTALNTFLSKGVNINSTNAKGESLLMIAVKYGASRTARVLIARGADINHTNKRGDTALVYAKRIKHNGLIEVLEEKGAI